MTDKNIQINRIKTDKSLPSSARSLLALDYMVFRIACTDLKFHDYSRILDLNEEDRNLICAVYHDGYSEDKCTYYLLPAGRNGKISLEGKIEKALSGTEGAMDHVTISQVDLCSREELPDHILLNLLLFSLSADAGLENPVCNITGGLYQAYEPNRRKYKTRERITTLKYRINKDLTLFPEVKTFMTKESFKKRKKEIPEGEPEYFYDEDTRTMHRAPYSKGKYVLRRSDDGRTEIEYLKSPEKTSIEQPDGSVNEEYHYDNGKLPYLSRLMKLFDETFEKYRVSLSFDFCPQTFEIRTSGRGLNETYKYNNAFSDAAVKSTQFSIISTNEDNEYIAEKICSFLEELDYQVDIGGSGLPLVLIESPHRDQEWDSYYIKDWKRQHLTYRSCREKEDSELKSFLLNTMNNAVVKDDLLKGDLTLYDAGTFSFDCIYVAVSFPWCLPKAGPNGKDKMIPKYYIIGIDNSGKIIAGTVSDFLELHDSSTSVFQDTPVYLDKLCEQLQKGNDVEYAVQIGDNINTVYHSNLCTMPDMEYLWKLIEEKQPYSRAEVIKDDKLVGLNDLRSFELDGDYYYFVGEKSNNMNDSVAHAPNARLVKPLDSQQKILIPQILPLMCVPFNRYEQLSVTPFPLKYLREYAAMDAHKAGYRLWSDIYR